MIRKVPSCDKGNANRFILCCSLLLHVLQQGGSQICRDWPPKRKGCDASSAKLMIMCLTLAATDNDNRQAAIHKDDDADVQIQ